MWTRQGRPHTVILSMEMGAESIKPTEFEIRVYCKHSEDRRDYSTWQLKENLSVPVELKENESFVKFLKSRNAPETDDLFWATSTTTKADTTSGGEHRWIPYPQSGFIQSAHSRIDQQGSDDNIQGLIGKLSIPFRVFVSVNGA